MQAARARPEERDALGVVEVAQRRERRERLTLWVVWYALALHLVWGVVILIDLAGTRATPVHTLYEVIPNQYVLGVILVAVGTLAWFSLSGRIPPGFALLFVLPQQITLSISAIGAVHAMWVGMYADGVPRPHAFIIADQLPTVLAAILHLIAIYYHYGIRTRQ